MHCDCHAYSLHCVCQESRCPTSATKKADLINWLVQRGIAVPAGATRPELLLLCQKHRPEPQYVVDSLIREWGHEVVRLPPGHPELNAIEQVWGCVKRHEAWWSQYSERKLVPPDTRRQNKCGI